jgi:redox-sensing transcriptional repressor
MQTDIPLASIIRLARYYQTLDLLEDDGDSWVKSPQIGLGRGVNASQVRKDLGYLGARGTRGRGYRKSKLRKLLAEKLGLTKDWNLCIVGVGDFGKAMAGHWYFQEHGFPVRGLFDNDPNKVGQEVFGFEIKSTDELPEQAEKQNIEIAFITTPPNAGQQAADTVIDAGIKAILCGNEASIDVPEWVPLRNPTMFVDLAEVACHAVGHPPPDAPSVSIGRVARYCMCLKFLIKDGVERVTSERFGLGRGINPAQIRKDLAYFGAFGRPGYGYEAGELHSKLCKVLGIEKERNVAIVGAGGFGEKLLYRADWFQKRGFRVKALFDIDPEKIGKTFEDLYPVYSLDDLPQEAERLELKIGFVSTSAHGAQDAVDRLVAAGFRGIINFTEATPEVPDYVALKNPNLFVELAALSCLAAMNQAEN